MNRPDWAALVQQGRAKAHGISWNDAELHARYQLMIPAEYVRRGALTLEAFQELKAKDEQHLKAGGELPLEAMPHNDLVLKATSLGVAVTNQASDADLREAIAQATPEKPVKPKKKK